MTFAAFFDFAAFILLKTARPERYAML